MSLLLVNVAKNPINIVLQRSQFRISAKIYSLLNPTKNLLTEHFK